MFLIYAFIVVFFVALDQYSKQVIVTYIAQGTKREVIPNFFYITNVKNTGAAWSIMEGQKSFFIVVTLLAVAAFSYFLIKDNNKNSFIVKTSYLMIIGGAIGNLIDRVSNGFVIDFLDFYIFGYDFPVFNIADCFLTIGVFLYIVSFILENKNAKN